MTMKEIQQPKLRYAISSSRGDSSMTWKVCLTLLISGLSDMWRDFSSLSTSRRFVQTTTSAVANTKVCSGIVKHLQTSSDISNVPTTRKKPSGSFALFGELSIIADSSFLSYWLLARSLQIVYPSVLRLWQWLKMLEDVYTTFNCLVTCLCTLEPNCHWQYAAIYMDSSEMFVWLWSISERWISTTFCLWVGFLGNYHYQ